MADARDGCQMQKMKARRCSPVALAEHYGGICRTSFAIWRMRNGNVVYVDLWLLVHRVALRSSSAPITRRGRVRGGSRRCGRPAHTIANERVRL